MVNIIICMTNFTEQWSIEVPDLKKWWMAGTPHSPILCFIWTKWSPQHLSIVCSGPNTFHSSNSYVFHITELFKPVILSFGFPTHLWIYLILYTTLYYENIKPVIFNWYSWEIFWTLVLFRLCLKIIKLRTKSNIFCL